MTRPDPAQRKPSLAALCERAESLRGPAALRRLAARLESDGRAGARALGERCVRRARAREAETRRLNRLFALRSQLRAAGAEWVAGVDEVGVGPLAGPVVAAAVVLDGEPHRAGTAGLAALEGIDDSKRLTRAERERLDCEIRRRALAVSVAEVWNEEIDRLNIYHASLEAMRRAVLGLHRRPDHLLVDARTIPRVEITQTALIDGDARDGSIAAASIVAKVHRDALMERLESEYPGYGFARHKGYGTGAHLEALRRIGPSPIHRRSFAPVANLAPPS